MKRKMLVTDDDPCLQTLYRAIFDEMNFIDVDYADSPETCRNHLASNDYELVLMDICLTEDGRDGLTLLDEIVSINPATDVIMMSSRDDNDTILQCFRRGAKNFTSKNKAFLPTLINNVEVALGSREAAYLSAC